MIFALSTAISLARHNGIDPFAYLNDPSSVAAGVRRKAFDKPKPVATPKTLVKPQRPAVNCNVLLGFVIMF
ncbi:MAG: hypothetical protein IIA06_11050 [Proteobacteria bacterium]|nr:hypothetical protein [Pseudomonadota bacterium]